MAKSAFGFAEKYATIFRTGTVPLPYALPPPLAPIPSRFLAAVAHFLFRTRRNRRKTFCSARTKRQLQLQLQNIRKTFATCVGNTSSVRHAAWGMGHGGRHRMQASATSGNKARHCDEVGHDKFYDLLRNSNTKLNLMCARNILVRDSLPPPPLMLWQYAKYTQSVDNSKNTDTHKTQAEETAWKREKERSAANKRKAIFGAQHAARQSRWNWICIFNTMFDNCRNKRGVSLFFYIFESEIRWVIKAHSSIVAFPKQEKTKIKQATNAMIELQLKWRYKQKERERDIEKDNCVTISEKRADLIWL